MIWNANDGRLVRSIETIIYQNNFAVASATFSPDGQTIATGSHDGTVRLWDTNRGTLLHTFEFQSSILAVDYTPDGAYLIIGESDVSRRNSNGLIRILDIENQEVVIEIPTSAGVIRAIAVNPNSIGATIDQGRNGEVISATAIPQIAYVNNDQGVNLRAFAK